MSSFRFWETDIRAVRKINRSTIRRKNTLNKNSWVLKDIVLWHYSEMKRRSIYNGENRLFFAEALSRAICTFLKTLTPHYCTGHIKNLNHLYHYLPRLLLILSRSSHFNVRSLPGTTIYCRDRKILRAHWSRHWRKRLMMQRWGKSNASATRRMLQQRLLISIANYARHVFL